MLPNLFCVNCFLFCKQFEKSVPKLKEWNIDIKDATIAFSDIDGDGSGSINFQEFVTWALRQSIYIRGIH